MGQNVFLSIVQAVMEVLNKSHFILQMENCLITVAEHPGQNLSKNYSPTLRDIPPKPLVPFGTNELFIRTIGST